MTRQSDILLLFAHPLDDAQMRAAKSAIMACGPSVIAHQKDGQSRMLLVRFDPADANGPAILDAVRTAGLPATMAGG